MPRQKPSFTAWTVTDGQKKTCSKCTLEYPAEYPFCTNGACRQTDIKGIAFPEGGGQLLYVWGYRYPMLGIPTKDTMDSAEGIKRSTLEIIRFEAKRPFFWLDVIAFKGKLLADLQTFIERMYSANFEKKVGPIYEKNLLCHSGREFRRVLRKQYGERLWIDCLLGVYEMDFAYRYRIQDIFAEAMIDDMVKNPRKEILRLFDLHISREHDPHVMAKMALLRKIISVSLLVSPSLRKRAVEFFQELNMSEIVPIVNDMYWMGRIADFNYDFGGIDWRGWANYATELEVGWKEDEKPIKK